MVFKKMALVSALLCGLCQSAWALAPEASAVAPTQAQPAHKAAGLMLDIARHYYSPKAIKGFIDTLAEAQGQFLHLHFSDDENYALESVLLNQRAAEAQINAAGEARNPRTGKRFLTSAQLAEIKAYAAAKNIELIPEVDSPAHMRGIFKLLSAEQLAQLGAHDGQLDMRLGASLEFMQQLLQEVILQFQGNSRHLHLGGDEFAYEEADSQPFVTYMNRLAAFVAEHGLIAQLWNDGLTKKNLGQLSPQIEITYWSYDGDKQDPQEAKYLRKIRATLPELLAQGFKVWNYNSYYLYLNPNGQGNIAQDAAFAAKDLRNNWHLGLWDGQNRGNQVTNSPQLLGAALAIWGEDAGKVSGEKIYQETQGLLKAVISKTNE